jgi:hypothetical protein
MKQEVMKHHLYDRENQEEFNKNRYEVLEYWGVMDKQLVEEAV